MNPVPDFPGRLSLPSLLILRQVVVAQDPGACLQGISDDFPYAFNNKFGAAVTKSLKFIEVETFCPGRFPWVAGNKAITHASCKPVQRP